MDVIIELREQYGKVRKYMEEDWMKDPETEPYRSKYKAMDYLKSMKETLINTIEKPDSCNDTQLQGMLAVVYLQLGVLSLDTDELSPGEKYLNEVLKIVTNDKDARYILISVTVRNQLGILWCQRNEIEKSHKYLEESEALYDSFKDNNSLEETISFHEHFEATTEVIGAKGKEELEKAHTLTKYYLAQVYGKLGNALKSAIYCNETLRRQLECKDYDSIDWALNSATLSQFLMEKKLFSQARHHLAAASMILDRYDDNLQTLDGNEEEIEAKKEELRHRRADVARCWSKYGIFLLEESKKDLTDDIVIVDDSVGTLQDLWFTTLELAEYENQMSDSLVTTFEAARDIMLVTQRYLNLAKEYYSLEGHASDYIQIVQDHSSVLRHLSSFEHDHTRLCKMLRKRINMLEEVIKELNPQYYLNECRALWFELGELYHDLMHKKQTKISEGEVPNPTALVKANQLAEHSILNFQHFLDSVKNKQTNELPTILPQDLLRPTLVAHFYLGRLYYKLLTPDKRQLLQNTSRALDCFKYLVDYCNEHKKAALVVADELEVSQELMSLLQLKVKQMTTVIS